ncbi:cytochrome P450 [Dendryphion nanum]|uniref:Cytochrome P450 n=1 Tax=Dendryphion nanum TaxID=256645 RepID=A0A9P9EHU5_9PLEO|nr:cytochrome P450 [Dendryphion nanum]
MDIHISSVVVCALVLGLIWVFIVIKSEGHSKKLLPGQNHPLTRLSHHWDIFGIRIISRIVRSVMNGTILFYMDEIWDMYGDTYTSNILGNKVTFTRDAINIKQLLTSQWLDYDVAKGIRIVMFEHLVPGTIAATDGKEWEENRRKWRHYFLHLDQLFDMPFLEASFQNLVLHITKDEAIDMQPLFLDLATDLTSNFVLGESTNCIDPENQSDDKREYVAALKKANPVTAIRGLLGPVARFIPQVGYRANCAIVKGHLGNKIQKTISTRQIERESGVNPGPAQQTFLDRLLGFTDNPLTLNHNVTSLMMSNESISRPLSHTIWLLSRNSVVYEKLRKSVFDLVGYERPTYAQLTKFTYLKNIINESLRLLPPDPLTLRRANTDTWLPTGGGHDGKERLLIRRGERVVISIFGSHRNPANFGDDASEFRPERWDSLNLDAPGYLPFSMGPRVCIGRQLVLNTTTYILVRLVQTYSHLQSCDSREFVPRLRFSMSNENGVWVSMTPDLKAIQKPARSV